MLFQAESQVYTKGLGNNYLELGVEPFNFSGSGGLFHAVRANTNFCGWANFPQSSAFAVTFCNREENSAQIVKSLQILRIVKTFRERVLQSFEYVS